MLELQVVPEKLIGTGEWELALGMHLAQVISTLKSQAKSIRSVHFVTSDSDPLSTDIVLDLHEDGIRLIVCPRQQRLKRIEVYNMHNVCLKYCGQFFNNGGQVVPTIQQIEQSFGCTEPVGCDADVRSLVMSYRGICFIFPVDSTCDLDSLSRSGLGAIKYNHATSPVVSKMVIFAGATLTSSVLPEMPLKYYHGNAYASSVKVLREGTQTTGLEIMIMAESPTQTGDLELVQRPATIYFGDGNQAIQALLGSPCKIHYKSEDKMRIHSTSPYKMEVNKSDYFLNYFTLGLDVLMDATCHTAKKFILHTNFQGHFDFEIYHRCNFHLPIRSEPSACSSTEGMDRASSASGDLCFATTDATDVAAAAAVASGPSTLDLEQADVFIVGACTKWDEVVDFLGGSPPSKPVVLSRTSSTNAVNPFGPSLCYGHQNIIFEIIKQSGYIAAITLFPSVD